ncbi:MAG: protein translocase subunit SecD [Patescibacteria group bacterium]|nr:protein translocase subunit SecD [bacterium]MDZ4240931.1 protein translocase subunit SecD [Patescibacteria group bacterium]
MLRTRIFAALILILGLALGFLIYSTEQPNGRFAFTLGLDLNGGTRLVYDADTASLDGGDTADSLSVLKEVIERRVNLFGVSEPLVQVERSVDGGTNRLVVELPGITDVNKAVALIGQTPLLEFRLLADNLPQSEEEIAKLPVDEIFIPTGLTGKYLKRAQIIFNNDQAGVPGESAVLIEFNDEGKKLFATITREHVGKTLAIFLDGSPISTPVIREEISDGVAQVSGSFTPTQARDLVRNLNYGALPVPIELISTQKVGASLGENAVQKDIEAGFVSFAVISLFLLAWYRLPGLLAVVALAIYTAIMLMLFKLIPVTLTAAGIAGFILSIGVAVDANILIFERMKEEFKKGSNSVDGVIREGFSRAWTSIRDSNLSSLITAVILYWFSNTSIVKGFALILGIGVLVSMFTAITITRTFLLALSHKKREGVMRFLFSTGLSTK